MDHGEIDALQAEYTLTRRVVDHIPSMLAYWDVSGRCRFANRAYERWFGVTPESLIGKHISELLGPLYALNRPYIEAALRGEVQEFEREIPDPDGGAPRLSVSSYIPDVLDGVVRGFCVQMTDLSALKRVEQALRASEQSVAGIIAIAADAIISVDADQRIVLFNESAEQVFGYAKAEALGAPLGMLLPDRLRDRHRKLVESFAAGERGTVGMGERRQAIQGLRKGGEEFPMEATISKIEIGGRVQLTVALRDITERRRLQVELETLADAGMLLASSLDYEKTLKSIAQLIVRRAADLCIVDMIEADDRVRKLTVVHSDPTMAQACEKLAALQLDRDHTLARSALDTKQVQLFREMGPELWAALARDEEHLRLLEALAPRSAIVAPLLSRGEPLGAIVFASRRPGRYDTHDLPFATEIARRATSAIENSRLYESARRATRARDEVLGIVAHDVRNPLNNILLATKLLERQLVKEGMAECLRSVQTILRSISRANRLIHDLLDVARMEGGALRIAKRKCPAKKLLVDALEAEALRAADASIALRLDAAEGLPDLDADRDRLLQVLGNLVGNAIRFTPPGGTITLGATSLPGVVLFRVADTGTGIPPENLERVFERFWQATRADRHGAGLGLSICKGIVEGHHGRIWVESAPSTGTTFYFSIPTAPIEP